uniref:Ig-like domain-containing protein n=1 Tax=Astyanax mexicanus TaxID=7994 RepID=A0A3B1JYS1_ASTMX
MLSNRTVWWKKLFQNQLILMILHLLPLGSSINRRVVMKNQGESLTMTCTTTKNSNNIGLYLKARRPEKCELFYYANTKDSAASYGSAYKGRVTVSGEFEKLTVKITDLQKEDSGFYFCQYVFVNGAKVESNETDSLLLFVKGKFNLPSLQMGSRYQLTHTGASLVTAATYACCLLLFVKVSLICHLYNVVESKTVLSLNCNFICWP